jgi:endonuclease/exonuclease/phosphatase family metal-dependent hydrolase
MAVLSRFPIVANRPHTNASFLLNGRRVRVQRGFAEVDIRVNPQFEFTLIAVHLKSKLSSHVANEDDMREHEATLLREIIDSRLSDNPRAKLVVAGDFNDTKDSASVKIILGKGSDALWDTRPSEKNGDDPNATQYRRNSRTIAWTHYYAREDTYSRIDYIFLSPCMAKYWNIGDAHILSLPNWGLASDHRPIVATFQLKK